VVGHDVEEVFVKGKEKEFVKLELFDYTNSGHMASVIASCWVDILKSGHEGFSEMSTCLPSSWRWKCP
jgi:hypothetical protein